MSPSTPASRAWFLQVAADLVAVTAAYYTTFLVRFYTAWGGSLFESIEPVFGGQMPPPGYSFIYFYTISAPRIILIVTVTVCTLYALRDLYPGRRFILRRPEAWSILLANLIALALFYTYFYLRRNVFHPRSFFASLLFLNCIYGIALRAIVQRLLNAMRMRGQSDRWHALVVGSSEKGDALCGYIDMVHPHGIWIDGRIPRQTGQSFDSLCSRVKAETAGRHVDLILSIDTDLAVGDLMRLLEVAGELGAATKILTNQLDVLILQAKMPVDVVQGVPLLHFDAPVDHRREASKRFWSWLSAAVATVISLPLQLLIALAIKLTSPGPVLFVQERMGVNRKPFRMYKFRTMYDRAEESLAQMEEFNESGHGLFKMKRDPRVTPAGRFLRRFSLDELPQLYNVLQGDMTIVGPRPLPRRDFENYYEEWHYNRHGGMPGLTCLWQVSGRSNLDFHNMCILDLFYLRNQNWILDLKIVLRTIWVVLFAKGAY